MRQIRQPGRTLTYRKKAVFALLVTGLFFFSVEILLALFSVRPSIQDRDPFVGFESSIPLFERQSLDGQPVLQTAANKLSYFNPQRFAADKRPDTVRVFCIGGSTTFGRPYDDRTSYVGWLRELLPAADPKQHWQVINAGGISYASYRVASVLDELVEYSPDLFIVYTGHNEFLEERTYRDLQSSPAGLRHVMTALHRSRTFSLAQRLLVGGAMTSPPRFTLPDEVDAILDHSVGPDSYHRNDQLRSDVLEHFEFNLHRMIKAARSVGAEVLFVKPAANLKDFSPFKSEHNADLDHEASQRWSGLLESAADSQRQGRSDEALSMLLAAAEIDSGRADLHFQIAMLLFKQQRFAEARESFRRAVDHDICPLRSISDIQRLVEQTAIAERVPLVDFDSILMNDCLQRYGHGVPGREYFLDHVHPTIETHRLLALSIIQAMRLKNLVTPDPNWGDQAIAEASRRIESRVDIELQTRALTNLAQVLSWAGKQKEAAPLALGALRLRSEAGLADDAESMFYAAVSYAMEGDDAQAIELLQRVVQLEPMNHQARWRLATLLYDSARYEEARVHFGEAIRLKPQDAHSHQMLASVLIKIDQYEEALEVLSRASELAPDNPDIRKSIAMTRKKLGRG